MSDYQIAESGDLVQCPYDKSHMITVKRLQYHLMKCRKNHKGSQEYGVCPYNATHEMPKPELRHHMTICPDRAMVEKTLQYEATKKNESGDVLKGCTDVPAYNTIEIPTGENWDLEIPATPKMGVDPSFFDNQTRRSLAGMTPLEKRQFHSSLVPDIDDVNYREQHVPVGMKAESQTRMPKQQSSVFQYSLTMAGVGRGGGAIPMHPPSTIDPIYQQSRPHGLQANSNNSSKSLPTDAPESIERYLFFPGDRHRNNAHRRKFNTVRPDKQSSSDTSVDSDDRQTSSNISNNVQQNGTASMLKKGHGRGSISLPVRQVNSTPIVPPTSSLASKGIGRGERLQKGFCDVSLMAPPVKAPWASYLTEGVKKEEDFPALGSSSVNNDFPALGTERNSEIGAGDSHSSHNDELESSKKRRKAIRKRLGAIKKLEDKQNNGGQLTQEELNKVSGRKGLEEELNSLGLS